MPTNYPGLVSDLATNLDSSKYLGSSNGTPARAHTATHQQIAAEINAITAELGVNPSGTFPTVKARLDATPSISEDADNIIELRDDGLYATGGGGGGGGEVITVTDTQTVNLTKTGVAVTADVNISADLGNQLESRADGLYVLESGGGGGGSITAQSSNSVTLDIVSDVLEADVLISTQSENVLELVASGADSGLFVQDWKLETASHWDGTGMRFGTIIERVQVLEENHASQAIAITNILVTRTLNQFGPADGQPPLTGFATLDTRNGILVLDFDDTTVESTVFVSSIPENTTFTSLLVRIWWTATTATSGNVRWSAAWEKGGIYDVDVDSFDTTTEATGTTSGISGVETVTEITCTAIDFIASGNRFRLKVSRVGSAVTDTMIGDAELIRVEVRGVA